MRSYGVLCLFSLVVLFTLVQIGSAYRCYTCIGRTRAYQRNEPVPQLAILPNIPITDACYDSRNISKYGKVECGGKDTCLKTFFYLGRDKIVTRECGNPVECKQRPNHECHECDSDLCNSSTTIAPSLFLISGISFIFTKLYV